MDFSTTLAQLRQERQLSQRKVAADFNISQALLSHYEKGIREPRLDFVIRACDYYGVSADYILGRTDNRENPMILGGPVAAVWQDSQVRCFINSVLSLLAIISSAQPQQKFSSQAIDFLSYPALKLAKYMCLDNAETSDIPDIAFSALCDSAAKKAEAAISIDIARNQNFSTVVVSAKEELMQDFPTLYKSLCDFANSGYLTINRER